MFFEIFAGRKLGWSMYNDLKGQQSAGMQESITRVDAKSGIFNLTLLSTAHFSLPHRPHSNLYLYLVDTSMKHTQRPKHLISLVITQ